MTHIEQIASIDPGLRVLQSAAEAIPTVIETATVGALVVGGLYVAIEKIRNRSHEL